ncbi:hypothetical protein EBESD8_57790 [Rhodococcus aetherivorans]|nr:hypothetical protein EBESD8_57790 [Rhodococcus aetherivorans]
MRIPAPFTAGVSRTTATPALPRRSPLHCASRTGTPTIPGARALRHHSTRKQTVPPVRMSGN